MQFVNISTFKADYYVDYCATLRGTLPGAQQRQLWGPPEIPNSWNCKQGVKFQSTVGCSFHKSDFSLKSSEKLD